ncbi:MAG TPA: ribosomal L7Ae/L30e/S12e/Gadd45 family protein [Candidatus Nanoarchaeia archaeon]|nr:ribosomal L7Ae/L30e/S12e/Gadd45 family protein [Candidatus Nanoarchaeia archaeon]
MVESDKEMGEIRKLLKSKSMIIGTDRTLKQLKLGKIKKVYVSANCDQKTLDTISRYDAEVVKLSYPNDELGILCKKTFSISVLSVPK